MEETDEHLSGRAGCAVVVIFPLSLTPMGSQETLSTENRLEQIGWLVGGKWVAEAEGPDGKPMIRESFFKWAANRRALRFWSVVKLNDGKVVPYVEGAYFWHPGKKSLWFWYVDPGS